MSVELISVLIAVLAIGVAQSGPRPARAERSMNLCRYFLPLLVVLLLSGPLSAQETDEEDHFYLGFAGSAIFPYEPAVPQVVLGGTENFPGSLGGPGNKFKTGAGFTAAFGYAFKEGFSTEMEWGYQKIRTDNPTQNLSLSFPSRRGFLDFEGFESTPISITIENSGEIKTWSLMGNVYYRYPKWRVSPYAGFGLGAFFHDRTATSIAAIENLPRSPFVYLGVPIFGSIFSDSPPRTPQDHSHIRGFPVCLSDHGRSLGSGLQARGVPLWLSLSLKPRGADRCRPN